MTDTPLPLETTLQVSQLMYRYADLRKILRKHELSFNKELDEETKERRPIVSFKHPEYVDPQNSDEVDEFPSTKLKSPVKAHKILEFIHENRKFLTQKSKYRPIVFDETETNNMPLFMQEKLESLADIDADILEFDDEFSKSELVYAIIVNRTEKRIVVVFRGSYGLKDFIVDANFFPVTPKEVKEFTDNKNVKMHAGFAEYLFKETGNDELTKFQEIIQRLKEIYAYKKNGEDYSKYELVVTGHSLGGALAQELTFMLAGLPKADFIPKPIVGITFASPVVGNGGFFEVARDLERENKFRHIRVSNEYDVVPGKPPLTGYTQTGVNLHARDGKEMEVAYENTKTIPSLLYWLNPLRSLKSHFLEGDFSYQRHIFMKNKNGRAINERILSLSVSQIYEDYAGVHTN